MLTVQLLSYQSRLISSRTTFRWSRKRRGMVVSRSQMRISRRIELIRTSGMRALVIWLVTQTWLRLKLHLDRRRTSMRWGSQTREWRTLKAVRRSRPNSWLLGLMMNLRLKLSLQMLWMRSQITSRTSVKWLLQPCMRSLLRTENQSWTR